MKQSQVTLVTLAKSCLRLADSQSNPRYVNHPSQDQQNHLTDTYLIPDLLARDVHCYASEAL